MQLMTNGSQKGNLNGLGWIDAKTVRLAFDELNHNLRPSHMGWNTLKPVKKSKNIAQLNNEHRFYFVHYYYVKCNRSTSELSLTKYCFDFCSAFEEENIYGVQFHHEKSHKFGIQLLKNFLDL